MPGIAGDGRDHFQLDRARLRPRIEYELEVRRIAARRERDDGRRGPHHELRFRELDAHDAERVVAGGEALFVEHGKRAFDLVVGRCCRRDCYARRCGAIANRRQQYGASSRALIAVPRRRDFRRETEEVPKLEVAGSIFVSPVPQAAHATNAIAHATTWRVFPMLSSLRRLVESDSERA